MDNSEIDEGEKRESQLDEDEVESVTGGRPRGPIISDPDGPYPPLDPPPTI